MRKALMIFMVMYICLMLCACAEADSASDASGMETEAGVDEKESEIPFYPQSKKLAKTLVYNLNYNGLSTNLPSWAHTMLWKELTECLADADSGNYAYELEGLALCNDRFYFSMMVQGSRTLAGTDESENVAFCVTLDKERKCLLSLTDYVEKETIQEALAEGAYALIQRTDLEERLNVGDAADVADTSDTESTSGAADTAGTANMSDAADTAGTEGGAEAYKALLADMDSAEHYYDYYINRESGVGFLLDMWQKTDSQTVLELDGDWVAAQHTQIRAAWVQKQIEDMFVCEVRSDGGREYAVITGINEEYRENFVDCLRELTGKWTMHIPDRINGIMVEEIGEDAFKGIEGDRISLELPEGLRIIGAGAFADTVIRHIRFPESVEQIGAGAFENCGLTDLNFSENLRQIGESAFENCALEILEFPGGEAPVIGERAFAGNPDLWAVYVPEADCVIGEDAFAGCAEAFYLVYGENVDGREDLVRTYAEQSGLTALEFIPAKLEVNYPETPFVLTPEVRNFFYGENGDGDHFDSFEFAEDATDYGFEEWHAPCGEFCAGTCYVVIEASSELASANGRYSADNLSSWAGRSCAWSEGVEGVGIGESITYYNYNQWNTNNWREFLRRRINDSYDISDGDMRYTEICIVNGYAKSQKTWEENGRVKRLLMYVEDKPYAYLDLEDTILPQYFTLPSEDIKSPDGGVITFRFEIEDVYPGTVYEDTCLTGLVLEFTGRHGH